MRQITAHKARTAAGITTEFKQTFAPVGSQGCPQVDDKTRELIEKRLREFEELGRRSPRPGVLEYKDWADRSFSLMNYGERIPWSWEIADIQKYLSGFVGETDQEGFRTAKNAASRMYDYLEEQLLGERKKEVSHIKPLTQNAEAHMSQAASDKKVFIVHGHDEAKKWELKNYLVTLGLEPIILHEQDDLGKTIIEKFEYYAAQCKFAFILLTPDDVAHESDATERAWRARQNVIMELGWFMAKLGRERVLMLHKGRVEIPSDILGIVYLSFEKSVMETGEKIRQRLKGEGLL
jgi:predicted nucleotide-binding protein